MESQADVLGFIFFLFSGIWRIRSPKRTTYPSISLPSPSPKGSEIKRETELGSRAFVPVLTCGTIESIIWTTGGRDGTMQGCRVLPLWCRELYFIKLLSSKLIYSHRSDSGAGALIPSCCIYSIFLLSDGVSLWSIMLREDMRMERAEASPEMTTRSASRMRALKVSEKRTRSSVPDAWIPFCHF